MKFDPSKPVQTREPTNWTNIEIVRTDLESDYPIVAILTGSDGGQKVETFTVDGKLTAGKKSIVDLINGPEKHVMYMNIGTSESGYCYVDGTYKTRRSADSGASGLRTECIRVEFQEGQFDE